MKRIVAVLGTVMTLAGVGAAARADEPWGPAPRYDYAPQPAPGDYAPQPAPGYDYAPQPTPGYGYAPALPDRDDYVAPRHEGWRYRMWRAEQRRRRWEAYRRWRWHERMEHGFYDRD